MRSAAIFFFLLCLASISFGQKSKIASANNYLTFFLKDNDKEALGKAKEAIDLAAAHDKSKNMAKTWYYRGMIYQNIYDNKDQHHLAPDALTIAFESFQKTLFLDEAKKEYHSDVIRRLKYIKDAYYNEAAIHLKKEAFQPAFDNFSMVLTLSDYLKKITGETVTDTLVMSYKAYTAEKIGKPDIAKVLYAQLIGMGTRSLPVFQSLARIYSDENDLDNALEVLQKGRTLYPRDNGLIIDELNIFLRQGRLQELIEKLEKAIELDPHNPDLYYVLGTAFDSNGEPRKASGAYEKALMINPDYFEVLYNQGALYYNQAIELNKQMNELSAKQMDVYAELKAKRDGHYQSALPYFERALALNENDINSLTALKEIYARTDQLEKSNIIKKRLESLKK